MPKNSSKKNNVSSVSSVSSIDNFPAIPAMFDRLRRLNHGISTLTAKVNDLEAAIQAAPINLQTMQDDSRINAYIQSQLAFGVEMPRAEAVKLLGIIRNNQTVMLNGCKIPVKTNIRSSETLDLKENDREILALYRVYGFKTHSEFCKSIQDDNVKVTSAVLSRYSGIAKQIAYLEGKESNNGYLSEVQTIGCTPLEILSQLSKHPKSEVDTSTFALTKRAVKIYAALQ